jgi:hypothetical protein
MERLKFNLINILIGIFIIMLITNLIYSLLINSNDSLNESIIFFISAYLSAAFIVIRSRGENSSPGGLYFSHKGLCLIKNGSNITVPWSDVKLVPNNILFLSFPRFVNSNNNKVIITFLWGYYSSESFINLTKKYVPKENKISEIILKRYIT